MGKKPKKGVSNSSNSRELESRHTDKVDSYETARVRLLPSRKTVKKKPNILMNIINTLIALSVLLVSIGIVWRGLQPASFNQFWKKNINPLLPPVVRPLIK